MKKLLALLLVIILALPMFACGDNKVYTDYDLQDALEYKTVGFGAQIDPDLFIYNDFTEEEEQMIKDRVEYMNLQYARVKFFVEHFERANDNDDPNYFDWNSSSVSLDNEEMQALFKVLDICEANNINVDFSSYGCLKQVKTIDGEVNGETWLGWTGDSLGWVTAPKMVYEADGETLAFDGYAEYAENISALLSYLLDVKGYTCIYGISIISEMFIDQTGARNLDEYVKCSKVIDDRLKADGLRDRVNVISVSLQTHNASARYFKEEQEMVKDYSDVLGVGNYNWDYYDDIENAEVYYEDYNQVAYNLGKPGVIISEFCQGHHFLNATDKTDIDDYTAGMYIAKFMIAAISNGVIAMDHYILGDTLFNGKARVHTMGLWMFRDNGVHAFDELGNRIDWIPSENTHWVPWAAHPEYYFWGLICKYTDIGSEVYPIEQKKIKGVAKDKTVTMVALKLPDNSWSYIIVNDSDIEKNVAINNANGNLPNKMNVYHVTEEGMPNDRAVVLPSASKTINGGAQAKVSLPPFSLTVVSSKGM